MSISFGEYLKFLCRQSNIKLITLSESLYLEPSNISRWTHGILLPGTASVYKLIDFFTQLYDSNEMNFSNFRSESLTYFRVEGVEEKVLEDFAKTFEPKVFLSKTLFYFYAENIATKRRSVSKKINDTTMENEKIKFDVFLCHNSKDKSLAKDIGNQLKIRGITPWLDEWNLRPGLSWQRELEKQIENINSAAVFVGKDGLGPWQDLEIEAFLREFVSRGCPVIPIILCDCVTTPNLPVFLRGMTWVDFRKNDPDPFKQLIWGITGKRDLY